MRSHRHFLIIGFFAYLYIAQNASAQNFGGNSWGRRWYQINTDTVRVIFPKGLNTNALHTANLVHYMEKYRYDSIGPQSKKISIVLQNKTVISNGYVGLAPLRSEFYLNAPQDAHQIGANWNYVLPIHEYRHVQQLANSRRGLTGIVSYLFGQYGWSGMKSLALPDWFIEGDAVVIETNLTAQGRGRIPAFYNDYNSLWLSNKIYNYQKSRNGSLRDFVPSEYHLGYLLCDYGQRTYGNNFWSGVLADASAYKGLFYPFSGALKRRTGTGTKGFYNDAMAKLSSETAQVHIADGPEEKVNTADKRQTFTSYEFATIGSDGAIIALVHSYNNIPAIMRIADNGAETEIVKPGRAIDYYFTHRNGKLLWAELGHDERWSNETNSNVVVYDISKKERRRITHNAKYLSPDLSPDGLSVVVYEFEPDGPGALVVLGYEDGRVLKKLPNPQGYYFAYPRWAADNSGIYAIARDDRGLSAIVYVDAATGTLTPLMAFTNHQLGYTVESGDKLYFSASFSGVDQVYSMDKKGGSIDQVTEGNLGAYQPAVDAGNNMLFYSRFSNMGYDLYRQPKDKPARESIQIVEPRAMEQFHADSLSEDITGLIPAKNYPVKKYSQFAHPVNIHSWIFQFSEPVLEWSLYSQNILNTLLLQAGTRYNTNDKSWGYFASMSYSQLYPVINFSLSNQRRSKTYQSLQIGDPYYGETFRWWEKNLKTGLLLPLDLSAGRYRNTLNLTSNYSFFSVNYDDTDQIKDYSFNVHSIENGVEFLRRQVKARRNIFAKNSQYLSVFYNNSIGSSVDSLSADQLFIDSEWTFGAVGKNDNLVFQVAWQENSSNYYWYFEDRFVYSRGYTPPGYDKILKVSANYHAPLAYPDWGIWGMVYLYRLRSNVFFDYSRTFNQNFDDANYNSTGLELIFDTRMLNYYDFTIGVRYAWLLNDNPNPDEGKKYAFEVFVPLLRF